MNWISLAFRNLLRNARRSITTIAAVALGYAAVNILAGFAAYMFASIEDGHIYEQLSGHIQIWKTGAREYGGTEPEQYLITKDEYETILAAAAEDPRILLAGGMLEVRGSIDHDGIPAFFFGQAMVPEEKETIQERSTALRSVEGAAYEGRKLSSDEPDGIGVTPGMAESLGIGIGDDVILMAAALSGQMNALDARVVQIADTANEAFSNRFLFLPLELAQSLYDTDGVSCVRIVLEKNDDTDAVTESLRRRFAAGEWEITPWHELSKLYGRTKRMFDIIFGLVFAIIAVIVTMSVLNTIGMAVVERTREIGTLRALGLKRGGVVLLFGIESALLGFIGAAVGLALALAVEFGVALVQPTWEPPVATREIVWEIRVLPPTLFTTFILLVLFTSLAAIAPARRAAKQGIVDSLGHV